MQNGGQYVQSCSSYIEQYIIPAFRKVGRIMAGGRHPVAANLTDFTGFLMQKEPESLHRKIWTAGKGWNRSNGTEVRGAKFPGALYVATGVFVMKVFFLFLAAPNLGHRNCHSSCGTSTSCELTDSGQ
jgi:hypothetical protein